MQLKITTTKLQELLSRATRGVGNNKLIPLTTLMAIQLKNNILTLITTDATNYLYVRDFDVTGDDFYAVIQVDTFAKLISKMSCEYITLTLQDGYMTITGNGTYKIEMPLDEDGSTIEYPNPAEMVSLTNSIGKISNVNLFRILGGLKQSLMTTNDYPWYTNYYVGESVIATDTYKISSLAVKLFTVPKLISAEQMNLLSVLVDDEWDVYADGDKMLFTSEHCTVYGIEPTDIEEFNVEAINSLVNRDFASKCKIAKNVMLGLLDRINLFVGAYDNGEVILNFTQNGILVSSKKDSGAEQIEYLESSNVTDFICSVNISMLMSQIKAQTGDTVEMYFGDDSSIKLIDDNITSVIALLTE